MIKKTLRLIKRTALYLDAAVRHNSHAVGADLRKLGLGMTAAGWIGFFIPSSDSQNTFWLISAGLLVWVIGVVLTSPK